MSDTEFEALRLARQARVAPDQAGAAGAPHKLWEAAQRDVDAGLADRLDPLYFHALIEAGYVRDASTGLPYEGCPKCGWEPPGEADSTG